MEKISMVKLHDEIVPNLGDDDLILDVRTEEEFEAGHVKGARNKDHEEVEEIVEELKKYKTVYVHCKMGGRAQRASAALEAAGLTNIVCVSDGGMQKWMDMGWETE